MLACRLHVQHQSLFDRKACGTRTEEKEEASTQRADKKLATTPPNSFAPRHAAACSAPAHAGTHHGATGQDK